MSKSTNAFISIILGWRQRWSTPEKEVLRSSTERHSSEGTMPSLVECKALIEDHELLKNRTPLVVKSFLFKEIKRKTSSRGSS